MSGWFKSLKGEPKEHKIVAFDIEGGGGYRGFVCGSIVSDNLYKFYTNREEMQTKLMRLLHEGAWIFAHNLQYDLPLLEADQFPKGDLLFSPHGLLWGSYTYHDQKHKIYDSVNLFPRLSIDYLGGLVGVEKVTLPENTLRRLARGQPWEVFTDQEQKAIRLRVSRDAEILFLAIANLQELVLSLGGQLKPTIAGVAMDIYRRSFHRYPWQVLGPETNKMARPAFYGGRSENFAFGEVEPVNMYDVTSLYPYAQSIARYPHPSHLKLELAPKRAGEWLKWEGSAEVTLEVPESFIPVVPYRHNRRLFFPTGRLVGQWTIYDIREALRAGAILKGAAWVLGSPVTFNPFEDFVETLFARRQSYLRSGSPQANLVKLILNSLYGRWGLNEDGGLYRIVNVDQVTDFSEFQGYTTDIINGSLFAFGRLENLRRPDYVNVMFSSQIASVARSHLNNELLRQGENSIYCDTDSIITRGEVPTGDGLGKWRLEMAGGKADLLGPKEYALHNLSLGSRYIVKGLPENVSQAYFEEGTARFYRALSIREALNRKQEPTEWIETYKNHGAIFPKRFPVEPLDGSPAPYYSSLPYQREELEKLDREPVGGNSPTIQIHERVFPAKRRGRASYPGLAVAARLEKALSS